jgi:hypothetical protein
MSDDDPTQRAADHDPTERAADPSTELVHQLIYGDEETSGPQLRNFIRDESLRAVHENAFAQRASADLAASRA